MFAFDQIGLDPPAPHLQTPKLSLRILKFLNPFLHISNQTYFIRYKHSQYYCFKYINILDSSELVLFVSLHVSGENILRFPSPVADGTLEEFLWHCLVCDHGGFLDHGSIECYTETFWQPGKQNIYWMQSTTMIFRKMDSQILDNCL